MPDETSTPPADTQAPPPQSGDTATGQASEPASVIESMTPPPEAAAHAPEPELRETPTPTEAQASVTEPEPLSQSETGMDTSVSEPTPEPQQNNPPSSVPDSAEATTGKQDYGRAQQPQTTTPTSVPALHGDIAKARAAMQDKKRKKLDKIMAKLSEKGKITNDEVEKLLHVSDATATRYLQALEKENKIKQTGSTGTGVFYEKI